MHTLNRWALREEYGKARAARTRLNRVRPKVMGPADGAVAPKPCSPSYFLDYLSRRWAEASELDISEITVKAHHGSVMDKTNARTFSDVVEMAAKLRRASLAMSIENPYSGAASVRRVPVAVPVITTHRFITSSSSGSLRHERTVKRVP